MCVDIVYCYVAESTCKGKEFPARIFRVFNYRIISPINKDNLISSFFTYNLFISSTCFIALAKI